MKKLIAFIIILATVLILFAIKYYSYKSEYNQTQGINAQYESYCQQVLYGNDVATIINRAVNNNENNNVPKDSNGLYIDNNINSIRVDVKILDNDTLYKMETLYNGGMTNFVLYYNDVEFECTKIEYHQSTRKIKYMLFEQKNE